MVLQDFDVFIDRVYRLLIDTVNTNELLLWRIPLYML